MVAGRPARSGPVWLGTGKAWAPLRGIRHSWGVPEVTRSSESSGVLGVSDPEQAWREALAAGLVGRSKRPLNCEVRPAMLGGDVTPNGYFFRRNHFPIPEIDPASWQLDLTGMVREPISVKLAQLRAMRTRTVNATLECAGNGRALFSPAAPGEQWELGAVSTARWTGVPLSDVLDLAGPQPAAREVIFRGADHGQVEDQPEPIHFERSLPAADAGRSGALLAYEMNGEPLPPRHGFPVRLIVPGWYAVASVKWLTEIVLTAEPFRGFFQDTHYVYEWDRDGRPEREPVRLQRVRAMVVSPAAGQHVAAGDLVVTGVAWSGFAPVTEVDVRIQSGSAPGAWQPARLAGHAARFGWQQWELPVTRLAPGPALIQARAADAAGHDQSSAPEWNELGYGANFVHEVPVMAA
jgi:DMSO/TMAO reductase YedYZ molybdopterin-dependent catalytic subunit